MNVLRCSILGLLMFSLTISALAQSTPYTRARDWSKSVSIGAGLSRSFFMNENFRQNIESGALAHSIGALMQVRIVYYPLILDAEWNSCLYEVEDDYPIWSTYTQGGAGKFRHRSLNASASLALLPFSRHITPYLGAGYQVGTLGRTEPWINLNDDEENPQTPGTNDYEGVVALQTPFWKFGLMIAPVQTFEIAIEYRHSLGLEQDRAFSQVTIAFSRRIPFDR